jgi:cell division septum initiation protein DivIVA
MIDKLTNYASIIGVIGAIGGGFYAWGEFNTRLDGIESKEFVVNETVDLTPINEKISNLEVEILDRMSALEDEWMARDNDTNDDILNDIAGINSDIKELQKEIKIADQQLQSNISDLRGDTFKEFGKLRDLINELSKLISIVQKENELQNILIDEIKTQNSNPLG